MTISFQSRLQTALDGAHQLQQRTLLSPDATKLIQDGDRLLANLAASPSQQASAADQALLKELMKLGGITGAAAPKPVELTGIPDVRVGFYSNGTTALRALLDTSAYEAARDLFAQKGVNLNDPREFQARCIADGVFIVASGNDAYLVLSAEAAGAREAQRSKGAGRSTSPAGEVIELGAQKATKQDKDGFQRTVSFENASFKFDLYQPPVRLSYDGIHIGKERFDAITAGQNLMQGRLAAAFDMGEVSGTDGAAGSMYIVFDDSKGSKSDATDNDGHMRFSNVQRQEYPTELKVTIDVTDGHGKKKQKTLDLGPEAIRFLADSADGLGVLTSATTRSDGSTTLMFENKDIKDDQGQPAVFAVVVKEKGKRGYQELEVAWQQFGQLLEPKKMRPLYEVTGTAIWTDLGVKDGLAAKVNKALHDVEKKLVGDGSSADDSWKDITKYADPQNQRIQLAMGMGKAQYVAELLGLHSVGNNLGAVAGADRLTAWDLKAITGMAFSSITRLDNGSGPPEFIARGTAETKRASFEVEMHVQVAKDGKVTILGGVG